jgi:hypothetical protein
MWHNDHTKFRQNLSYDSKDNRKRETQGYHVVISLILLY